MSQNSNGYPAARGHDIIVIGTSAGGIEALSTLVAGLPVDLPAALFVVLHTPTHSLRVLAKILMRHGRLPAKEAEDGELIRHGQIYIAPPDYHLLLKPDTVRVMQGPRENLWRPAIDPLFRSAAVAHGAHTVGVILSGMMDDGVAGLLAVHRCSGKVIVQTPDDAAFADLPTNALAAVNADYTLPVADMGAVLDRLVRQPAPLSPPPPQDLLLESTIIERVMNGATHENEVGELVAYSCPGCGGPLKEIKAGGHRHYRCSVGHSYTEQALVTDQTHTIEQALWSALRLLEERANMLMNLARDAQVRGRPASVTTFEQRAQESRTNAGLIRGLLQQGLAEGRIASPPGPLS
ncbi:MAG: chemotaxis protein CheB [Chloroflexota bacterium]|nr:chemotaxis protein CheB [Chloroflexota bacterium]